MARFNRKAVPLPQTTMNLAGGSGYRESAELEFAELMLTSFANDTFYRSANASLARVGELVLAMRDPSFAARAAIYARNEFGMRSITHAAAGEIARHVKGEQWLRPFFAAVVRRPDDITEILAYYMGTYGKPLPNSLKRGLRDAIGKFDTHALAKYKSEGSAVKMVDAINLLHPHPTARNAKALAALAKSEPISADTWEVALTKAGQKAEDAEELAGLKADAWARLIKDDKLGYFAMLRNLRNIAQQAPELLSVVCARLIDPDRIAKSLVLPFRFRTAYDTLRREVPAMVLKAIRQAAEVAMSNVPAMDKDTLVALDVSGSMAGKPAFIGAFFAAVMAKKGATVRLFDDVLHTPDQLSGNVMDIADDFNFDGGGTNFHAIFDYDQPAKRIIILSDMQGWAGANYGNPAASFAKYKVKHTCDPHVFSFNLNSSGTLMFPQPKVYCMAGFSEKVFDIMNLLSEDRNALVNKIKQVELT